MRFRYCLSEISPMEISHINATEGAGPPSRAAGVKKTPCPL